MDDRVVGPSVDMSAVPGQDERVPSAVSAHDPRHNAAYRAVLNYCASIHGIGPFEAEEIVQLVERAFDA